VTVVAATTAAVTIVVATTAATSTAVARCRRSEIQTHCFSTLDGIYWATF